MELEVGDLGNEAAVVAAFAPRATSGHAAVSHVLFCAGGELADFDAVNNRGVQYVAQQAVQAGTTSVVVISAAWVSKPYSLASLLFNSLYPSWPMARHMQGEQVLRQVVALSTNTNYVILRAGRLVPDEEYPTETAPMGLLYQQGDNFYFWGPAGQPGMCNTQLANAVLTAMQVQGKYTVEVTGGSVNGTMRLFTAAFNPTMMQPCEWIMTSLKVVMSRQFVIFKCALWYLQ